MKKVFLIPFLILIINLLSCGYTFQGSGSVLPEDIKYVYIPLVQNDTPEAGLSNLITEALRDRFERFGVVFVVESEAEADAILKARILQVKRNSQSTTSTTDTALQLETQIIMAADLKRVTGAPLWSSPRIAASRDFGSTSDVVVTSSADFAGGSIDADSLASLNNRELSRGQEKQAFEELAEEVAKRIYDQAVSPEF